MISSHQIQQPHGFEKKSQNILTIEKTGQFLAIPLFLSNSQTCEALLHSNNYLNDRWSLDLKEFNRVAKIV